jgi:hypothetical protein
MSSHHLSASRQRVRFASSLKVSNSTLTSIECLPRRLGAFADDLRRVACDDDSLADIAHRHGAGANDRKPSDRHVGPDESVGADPGTLTDGDGQLQEWQIGTPVVMRSGA